MSSDHVQITARERTEFGTRRTKRLRAEGLVPGVLYRAGKQSLSFALPERDLDRAIHGEHGKTAVFQISVDGHPTVPALLKDWDLNPVRGNLLHVDFQQVDLAQAVQANVPLVLVGLAVGVRDGGVLGQPVHELTISALPDSIPDSIEVDVAALEAGDVLHLSDVVAPAGVEIIGDAETVVASVTAASRVEAAEGEEGEAAEAAEPEVVGRAAAEEESE
jgi:large subunit ribosomal protein L25